MYQVYHKDSEASSTLNWGYRAILKGDGKYERELAIVEELSEIIDLARETLDKEQRKAYYAEALDMVMKLAVELPTYQRSDLYAYNTNIIDVSTLTPASELTPFNGPMNKLWEVSLKEGNTAGGSNGSTVIIIVIAAIVVAAGAGVGVFFVMKSKKAKAAAAEKAFMGNVSNETEKVSAQEEATEEKSEEPAQEEEPEELPKVDGEEKD